MGIPGKPSYSITIASQGDKITAVEEDYRATYNDSTRALWQELRDGFVEELGRQPGIPKRNDDHKIADFETSEYHLMVTLDNRSVPFLSVFYEMKDEK
jgi:very-short-patch-repair endonuclease